MAATIKDIAKMVGVNPSTVSRVINGTASISEETKNRIKQAMLELDYHPNSLARSLVNGSTFSIALVIDAGNKDAFSNAFFIQSVSAIEAVAQEKGFNLVITSDTDNSNAVKNLILEKKIDGIILPISVASEELVELLLKNQFPFILLGEPETKIDGVNWIDMDNRKGAEDAVNCLIRSGYDKPLLLVENQEPMFERKRIEGFKAVMGMMDEESERILIVGNDTDGICTYSTLEKFYEGNEIFDSVICTNNIIAFHVLKFFRKKGLRIPEDIGIVTFDNYPLAEYMDPPLTVIDVDTYRLGEEAANELFSIIQDPAKEKAGILLPTRIIERRSTGGKLRVE